MVKPSHFRIVPLEEALQAAAPKPQSGLPVVMIVDDERVIADTLSAIFRNNGYTVLTAYNGEHALEVLQDRQPNLLITDVMMPGMNGVDLAITIRETIPDCKILLFSGQAATNDLLAHARETGHDFETLAKPVHPTEMLARASECLMVA